MNISTFMINEKLYVNFDLIKGKAFDNSDLGDNCVISAAITANYGVSRNSCALLYRIERLSPQSCAA